MPRRLATSLATRVAALAAVVLLAAACQQPGSSVAGGPCLAPQEQGCTPLKVGLGYIPSVQFAPFYYADQQGMYRAAGLDVTFENKIDPDLVTLVGQGALDVGVADGTSVIPAVSQGIPIRYVASIYGTYPSIVFAKASSGITPAADLEGKKLGIPGKYGSSWIMLQALLGSVDLSPDDLEIVEYPDFGQGAAVQQGAVDAATGFANNEPVQLELTGENVVVLHVDEFVPLPGPGLIVGTSTLEAKRAAVTAFVQATVQAMEAIGRDPAKGLEAAIAAVPELASQRETQRAILDATIATWAPPGGGPIDFSAIDREDWQASIDFLTRLGMVPNPVRVDGLIEQLPGLPA